mgnify:FL=1
MIHLAISDSHLFCAQWTEKDGKPLLSSISYKSLPRSLTRLNSVESEIISVLNAGLHLIREDVPFEGEKVFVTIQDGFTQSVFVPFEQDMTENDGWSFAKWTLNHRWSTDKNHEYFGRSFGEDNRYVYAVRVPSTFTEPIKMAIQELGGEAYWMGTESSTFFGLNPEKGCTVFQIEKTGYNYHQYSQSEFQNGTARFLKGEWVLHAANGSSNPKGVFKGQLLAAGKLSDQRKAHFKGRRIKQMVSLAGINIEGDIIPKSITEEDLYSFTAVVNGTVKGVTLNFFDQPGFQPFSYQPPGPKVEPKPKEAKRVKKKKEPKILVKKSSGNGLKTILYIFFFVTIGIMLIYDQKPELFTDIIPKLKWVGSETPKAEIKSITPTPIVKTEPVKALPKYLVKSQSLIATALKTLSLTDQHQILLLSISDGRMDLELLGDKTMDASIDSIGDVLNYSLRQVAGDERFEHGYLVQYVSVTSFSPDITQSLEDFEAHVGNIQQSFFKALDSIDKDGRSITPVIVRVSGDNYIQTLLNHLLSNGQNIALEKFVYKGGTDSVQPSAIYYISIYGKIQSEPQG